MLPAETQRNITEQHGLHTNLSKLIIISREVQYGVSGKCDSVTKLPRRIVLVKKSLFRNNIYTHGQFIYRGL